ncbi:MAG: hypothetical protein JJE17_10835 [Peptostreptococcaceae bacterium]|nr:hypothetical protein [Peptostreptococcaceae bacterium]
MQNTYSVLLSNTSKKSVDFYKSSQGIENENVFSPKELMDIKADEMIKGFRNMIKYSNLELRDYFTVQEAFFIVASRNEAIYDSKFSPKSSLYINAYDSIKYDSFDVHYDVDPKIILDKLEKLTEFQAFCVIQMSLNYFLDFDLCFDLDYKGLRRRFLISEVKVE